MFPAVFSGDNKIASEAYFTSKLPRNVTRFFGGRYIMLGGDMFLKPKNTKCVKTLYFINFQVSKQNTAIFQAFKISKPEGWIFFHINKRRDYNTFCWRKKLLVSVVGSTSLGFFWKTLGHLHSKVIQAHQTCKSLGIWRSC